MRALSLVTACEWVHDAWKQLDPAIIVKAFLKCGISNALDGTEDDYLWRKPDALADSIQKDKSYKRGSENDDPLNSDDDLYDDAVVLRSGMKCLRQAIVMARMTLKALDKLFVGLVLHVDVSRI